MKQLAQFAFWLITLFLIFANATNIPKMLICQQQLDQIKDATLRSAQYEGGFHTRTMDLLQQRISESTLDPTRLEYIISPSIGENVQKRDSVSIILDYRFPYEKVLSVGTVVEDKILESKGEGVSQKFFK